MVKHAWRPYETHREALRRAQKRVEDCHYLENLTSVDTLVALADWMLWVINLDDQFAVLVGQHEYERTRRVSPSSHAILGVKYAWNLTKHHSHELESVVEITAGMQFPAQFPTVFREITWLPFERLPTVEKRFQRIKGFAEQQDAYKGFLAGRAVRHLAPAVTEHLSGLAVEPRQPAKR